MRTLVALGRGAANRLVKIDAALDDAYGCPEGELGNQSDPLDEAVYMILTFQTDLPRSKSAWSRLRRAYPSWDAVEDVRA